MTYEEYREQSPIWVRLKTSAWHLFRCEAPSIWDKDRTVVWTECLKVLGTSESILPSDYAYIQTRPGRNYCTDCDEYYRAVLERIRRN